MTDPRMTPTNDAPVTVEREAIERAIKATEYKYFGDYEMSDSQREAVDVLVETARHRLAALASAPAVAGEMPEYAPDDISHLEGLASYLDGYARDKGRAGLPASKSLFEEIAKRLREYDTLRASAPAGDGVKIERAVMDDVIREIYRREGWARGDKGGFPTVAARCNSLYTITAEPRRNRYVAVRAAALARPRAAVGEREAVARIIDPEAWHRAADRLDMIRVQREGNRSTSESETRWRGLADQIVAPSLAKADAILALQSPPAKVER